MNESFTNSGYDRLLFAFLLVFVNPVECYSLENSGCLWRAGIQWMLTIIRVALECWDTMGLAHLCHGT
jgi:hypothetical protein